MEVESCKKNNLTVSSKTFPSVLLFKTANWLNLLRNLYLLWRKFFKQEELMSSDLFLLFVYVGTVSLRGKSCFLFDAR